MKVLVVLAVLLAGLLWHIRYKVSHFRESLSPEEREEWDKALAEDRRQQEEENAVLKKLVVYRTLQESIRDGMSVDEMIAAFEDMCKISVGEPDDLLFETGTYDFTGEKLFWFSLVRQFQFMSEDEYVQLRLNILYPPSRKYAFMTRSTWGSLMEGNFFEAVKTSRAYRAIKDEPPLRIEIQIDET